MPRWPHVNPRLPDRDLPAGLAGAAPLLPMARADWETRTRACWRRAWPPTRYPSSQAPDTRRGVDQRSVKQMRQLTALDALFLAAENDRTHGHVSALGVL